MGSDRVGVHRNVDGLEADLAEGPPHDLWPNLLLMEHARRPHQIDEQVGHPLGPQGDAVKDLSRSWGGIFARDLRVRGGNAASVECRPRGRFKPRGKAASAVSAGRRRVGHRLHEA